MKKRKFKIVKSKVMIPPVIIGVITIGFLVWLAIRLITMDTELALNTTYQLPEFSSLTDFYAPSNGDLAVAIDGELAAGADMDTVRPTASTAKMILGLAVMREKPFELGEAGETITIDNEMYDRYVYYVNNGGSYTAVQPGEEISEYDALASVFLASSNNMADALAMWAFGSLENYREYAKQMLGEWEIHNTVIGPDASGFNPNTVSTAADLARIGTKVLENPVLREIVGTKSYTVRVAGVLNNTNRILNESRIAGIKTGWIGDASGYCLVTGYFEGEHIMTTAILGATTRDESFSESLAAVEKLQNLVPEKTIIKAGEAVGDYESWWTGTVSVRATEDLKVVGWAEAEKQLALEMNGKTGILKIKIGATEYEVPVVADDYIPRPSLGEKIAHAFGWRKEGNEMGEDDDSVEENRDENSENDSGEDVTEDDEAEPATDEDTGFTSVTNAASGNCTIKYGYLMLINPNFTVTTDFIDARRSELVSVSSLYGIVEGNPYNGDNLLDAEAAMHLNDMVRAYEAEYPGHTFETRSCYRARGTTCGRLCAATGASDHHTGLTCDLLDPAYGTSLDTDTYSQHIDWQWLYDNSYKYGFVDRFPEEWAGGSMDEPLNVDENGSTGLFETWHYRYVGVGPATEIATGKYNNGRYDSLEHYLKARGLVTNLKLGACD